MRAYIIRRLLLAIPTLFILTILVFLAVRFLPGDVVDAMVLRMQSFSAETEFGRMIEIRDMMKRPSAQLLVTDQLGLSTR